MEAEIEQRRAPCTHRPGQQQVSGSGPLRPGFHFLSSFPLLPSVPPGRTFVLGGHLLGRQGRAIVEAAASHGGRSRTRRLREATKEEEERRKVCAHEAATRQSPPVPHGDGKGCKNLCDYIFIITYGTNISCFILHACSVCMAGGAQVQTATCQTHLPATLQPAPSHRNRNAVTQSNRRRRTSAAEALSFGEF